MFGKVHKKRVRIILFFLLIVLLGCGGVSNTVMAAKKVALNHTKLAISLYDDSVKLRLHNAKGTVKWTSSDETVVSVKKGVLNAKAIGQCVIKAKYKNKVYTCSVTVDHIEKSNAFKKLLQRYPNKKSKGRIVLAGGSNLRNWGKYTKALPSKKIVNVAVGGSRISDWKRNYMELIVKQKPKAVVLYVGANDLVKGVKKDGATNGGALVEFLQLLQKEMPKVPIFYVSILPCPGRKSTWGEACISNNIVKTYCSAENNLYYIDCDKEFLSKKGKPKASLFRADGVHLNKKGQKVWNQLIAKKVKKKLK